MNPSGATPHDDEPAGPAGKSRPLVICVDDFGLHPGIDRACALLAARGRIHAVSCMTLAPGWGPSAELEQLLQQDVSVGLHIDFTEHALDAQLRSGLRQLLLRAYARRLDAQRLVREIHTQCERFETVTGRRPMHVDGHQHVHQFPVIRDAVLQVLLERYRGDLPWLRFSGPAKTAGTPRVKPAIIGLLGAAALRDAALRSGFEMSRGLLGVYDFAGGARRYRELLDRWTSNAGPGDVLMCHAATGSAEEVGAPAHWHARLAEFEVLSA